MAAHANVFYYEARRGNGPRTTGTIGCTSARQAVERLMSMGFAEATVVQQTPDEHRVEVGGIIQEYKGARRMAWWERVSA